MRPYIKIGLKNIYKNKTRSIVTLLLTSISTILLVFTTALMDGEHKIMLKNAVELYDGYIQITHKNFRDESSFDNLVENSSDIIQKLSNDKNVELATQRFETYVLFSSDTKSLGAMIGAIEPKKEEMISKLKKSLFKGKYLDSDDTNSIYLGVQLAKNLKVKVGDTISFVGTGVDYSFCADNLVVKGIFQTGLFEFDSTSGFVNKKYFDKIFASENLSTKIIVLPKDRYNSLAVSDRINKYLPKDLISEDWKEYMQSLVKAMEVDSVFGYITLAILFIVIFFVILIYTLLGVYSRIKEIGVLRAVGTKQGEVLKMLLFESSLLSFVSVVIGGAIGAYLAYYFSINPIDFGGALDEQFKQYGIQSTTLPTEFNPLNILRDMSIIFVLCVGSTLYPIFKINRIKPIEAINHV